MPKFVCSYAHDISCFVDFIVVAKNQQCAWRQIQKRLAEGRFETVDTTVAWENGTINERVFVQGLASRYSPDTTLADLIGRKRSNPT